MRHLIFVKSAFKAFDPPIVQTPKNNYVNNPIKLGYIVFAKRARKLNSRKAGGK